MKIRIEHESARSIANQTTPAVSVSKKRTGPWNSIILPFEMEPQQHSRWCWAAIAVSMARFYHTGRWRQSEVAGRLFGGKCSEPIDNKSLDERWNQNWSLDEALQVTGCFSHWSPGKPAFERVAAELDEGHPFGIRIEWHQGGAHYVVVFGYDGSRRVIYVADPQHGISKQPFDRFPHQYQTGGAVWTENFWTCAKKNTD